MWDEVKSPSSQEGTPLKGMEVRSRHLKRGKINKNSRLEFQTQKQFRQEGGSFESEPTQGGC
jgi:hypothetical protein